MKGSVQAAYVYLEKLVRIIYGCGSSGDNHSCDNYKICVQLSCAVPVCMIKIFFCATDTATMRQLVAALCAFVLILALVITLVIAGAVLAPSTAAGVEKSQFGLFNHMGLGESCSGLFDVCNDPMQCCDHPLIGNTDTCLGAGKTCQTDCAHNAQCNPQLPSF
jgi:hypothetical protein